MLEGQSVVVKGLMGSSSGDAFHHHHGSQVESIRGAHVHNNNTNNNSVSQVQVGLGLVYVYLLIYTYMYLRIHRLRPERV